MTALARCPCGQTPESLHLADAGQGGKYALVCGSCCDEWLIEFRTNYKPIDSGECLALATVAWNSASRGPTTQG